VSYRVNWYAEPGGLPMQPDFGPDTTRAEIEEDVQVALEEICADEEAFLLHGIDDDSAPEAVAYWVDMVALAKQNRDKGAAWPPLFGR